MGDCRGARVVAKFGGVVDSESGRLTSGWGDLPAKSTNRVIDRHRRKVCLHEESTDPALCTLYIFLSLALSLTLRS